LSHKFYRTGAFARKAAVSVRTLRYYDNVGLLSPSHHSESGYRLYAETDFPRLQQILALKFLGFSLQEIQQCIRIGSTILQESLALQKAMMQEKRTQLDAIIKAITETEALLHANAHDWESIVSVIRVLQMAQHNNWHGKYFTPEQMQQAEELSKKHYTVEQRQMLGKWGKDWTEAEQQAITQKWNSLFAELKRLVTEGQDPAGQDAQTLVHQWRDLVQQFTRGDAGIEKSLGGLVSEVTKMPVEERPYPFPMTKEEGAFLKEAMAG